MNIYLPIKTFEKELSMELDDAKTLADGLLSTQGHIDAVWALDILWNAQKIEFQSIGEAAKKLKEIHSHWVGISIENHRRTQLVQEKLNYYKVPEFQFMAELPKQKFGCFIMTNANTLYASTKTKNPIPFGNILFKENKNIPPSRAYLKLWELFTIYRIHPQKNDVCLDMGSCPGGWSWVLSEVCSKVISVDKAPLDDKIAKIKKIDFLKKDAFKLKPEEVGKIDWFFSDIICEPQRLYELIQAWREAGTKNFVCTIKFKGKTDFAMIEKFKSLPNSKLIHLVNNKHELTYVECQP